jgi:tetratricopeptide (TPR) repeat protein
MALGDGAGAAFGRFLENLADEPALVQLLLMAVGAGVAWYVGGRLLRAVRQARQRAAVGDFLLGVEQALHGDAAGAAQRLSRVLEQDPENVSARFLLGQALADLGQPGEAHRHHVELERGFGVRTRRNELALARSLLDAGRPADAVERAARAAETWPEQVPVLSLLFRAQLAAGQPEDAGRTGRALAALLPEGGERTRVRRESARALALAARVQLRAGHAARARELAAVAAALAPDPGQALSIRVGLELSTDDREAVVRALGTEAGTSTAARWPPSYSPFWLARPAGHGSSGATDAPPGLPDGGLDRDRALSLPAVRSAGSALGLLARIAPEAGHACAVCGGDLAAPQGECPHCGARDSGRVREPELFEEIDSPSRLFDAIEENRAHVQRLIEALVAGEAAAADELVEVGDAAVEETLAAAIERGPADTQFVDVLHRMGARIVPVVLDCYAKHRRDWLARFGELLGKRSASGTIGRVVQGFGRDALPYFDGMLATDDRELRKIVVDYFIGLADPDEFHQVLQRFPPVEVIHRLNGAPAAVLRRFLEALPIGSFLAEVLLVDPAFAREVDLLEALPQAREPSAIEGVLVARGFGRNIAAALVERLADPRIGAAAGRVLDSYGPATLSFLIAAFADLDRDPIVRHHVGRRIAAFGAAALPRLCDCFGATAMPLDDDLLPLLSAAGELAIEPLVRAYRQGSLLEKFARPLASRHTHRRVMIVRALAAVGGPRAARALGALRARETDGNLKLRLAQVLHSLGSAGADDQEEADRGQAG